MDAPNVVVEAVKEAEEGGGVIVRLYECAGRAASSCIRFGFPLRSVAEVDLLEEHLRPLELDADAITLDFCPFEIVSLRVTMP